MTTTIYVLYNANSTVGGKLKYAYSKLTAAPDQSPCSACDLTHGGLRLTESRDWTLTKNKIGAEVLQLHRDELDQELKDYIETNHLRFPLVLGRANGKPIELLMTGSELQGCSKDHNKFLDLLKEKCGEKAIPLSEASVDSKI